MNAKCLQSKIAHLVKTTLIDFPHHVAVAVFFTGCNLRCPYCYNVALAEGRSENDFVSFDEIVAFLEKRKRLVHHLVISGGEALLHECCAPLIDVAKSFGYKIKLDTNGTLPEKLSRLIENPHTTPDYIAMDIKTSPRRYDELLGTQVQCKTNNLQSKQKQDNASELQNKQVFSPCDFETKIRRSIEIISRLPSKMREWRTVCVPSLVGKNEITEIVKLLPKDARYFLHAFQNTSCLDKRFQAIKPYSESEMSELEKFSYQFSK